MLQRFLHLETVRRPVRIDYWGALFITAAASLPLIWVSFAGSSFAWWSLETAEFLGAAAIALVAAVLVERRHPDALVPPHIVSNRITRLSILASLAVGVAQFGASVFLAQYFQIARNHTPTQAGLLMLPLIAGNMVGATGTGQYITRTGRWKGIMLVGSSLLVVGLCLMGTIDHLTPMWHLSVFMVLMGLGTGALMQNLVLVVQNTVDVTDVGAASGTVSFFRSLAARSVSRPWVRSWRAGWRTRSRPAWRRPACRRRATGPAPSTSTTCHPRWPRSCARRTPTRPGRSS